jgi:hypothetical protein
MANQTHPDTQIRASALDAIPPSWRPIVVLVASVLTAGGGAMLHGGSHAAALERELAVVQVQVHACNERLKDIDSKVDRLLERMLER